MARAKNDAPSMGAVIESVERQAFTTAAQTNQRAKLPDPCVYCGPSVKGVARQYTTYQGGIPDALRGFLKENPAALGLIVSTGEFPAMRRRLETPGTPEAKLYKAVKARINGATAGTQRNGYPL